MESQGAEGGREGGGGPTGVQPQVQIALPEQPPPQATLQPPGKESVSSTGSTSSGGAAAPWGTAESAKGQTQAALFLDLSRREQMVAKHGGLCYQLYGDLLTEHDVGGRTLIRMNEIKLEKIGITNVEHRHELMQHILRLRLKHEMADLKNLDQRGVGFDLKLPDPRPATVPADKNEKPEKVGGKLPGS